MKKDFFITQPKLPNIVKITKILSKAWKDKILSNQGHLHCEFDSKLSKFWVVSHSSLCKKETNGLIIAQKPLLPGFEK